MFNTIKRIALALALSIGITTMAAGPALAVSPGLLSQYEQSAASTTTVSATNTWVSAVSLSWTSVPRITSVAHNWAFVSGNVSVYAPTGSVTCGAQLFVNGIAVGAPAYA